jgi:8-oxo-dGTP diphosphatase
LSLPTLIAITPDLDDADALFEFCRKAVAGGAGGIQLRAPQLSIPEVCLLYRRLERLAGIRNLWLNSRHLVDAAGNLENVDMDFVASIKGVHFCARQLVAAQSLMATGVFAHCSTTAACHNAAEIILAETADVDAILLSPVMPTASHPEALGLGWTEFARLVQAAKRPVYALGGMDLESVAMAQQCYAQGVAGISLFL